MLRPVSTQENKHRIGFFPILSNLTGNFQLMEIQSGKKRKGDEKRCESDGSVFASCNIGQAINERRLNLPEGLDGTCNKFLYVFVGDKAFPLKSCLIKPYPRNKLDDSKRICNYRISRARRVIKNTFGTCAPDSDYFEDL